jgi:hypothetical protein
MVAGGGAGGCDNGGAGGAGGLIFSPSTNITSSQTITVGAGAVATPNQSTAGEKGKDTTFGSLTAKGGGCGANGNGTTTPLANMIGGSGGGGDGENTSGSQRYGGTSSQSLQSGDSGTYGYGNAGGNGSGGAGGGGGGAGAAGANGESVTNDVGGIGGDGLKEVTIGGTVYNFATIYGAIYGEVLSGESWFAGGGGGGNENSINTDVNGGKGGGGKGLGGNDQTDNIIKYGKAHTGGGGGGQTHAGEGYAGGGGSGIVIVHWSGSQIGKKIPKIEDISNVTTMGSKTINYTFNTQGTGIDKITYKIGSGSEVSTASGVYTLAYTPADFGTTVLTYAYPINSSSTKIGPNFGPYSVATKLSSLGHISPAILLFMSMGTTVTDSVNNVAFTTASGSFTYDTTNNAITNSSSARMKLDFTSVRTDRATAISAFYEFYLPSGTQYEYAASLGGVHDGTGNNNDAIGWYGGTTPTTHYWANGTLALPTQYNYSNYYGKWVKLGWVREASGNNFKIYVDGVLASTHTPSDGSLTGTGVLSYFYLFRHACGNDENRYTTNDAISFRNLEIYQASFTDAQILAAYGP